MYGRQPVKRYCISPIAICNFNIDCMEEFRDNFLKFYIDKEEQMEHIKMGRISTDEIGGFANLV